MKLQTRLIFWLLACFILIMAMFQLFQYLSVRGFISDLAASNLRLLKDAEERQAMNIYRSVQQAVQGSLERGEMEKFTRILHAQKEVEGLLEFSLFNREGIVTYSSDDSNLKKSLPADMQSALASNSQRILRHTDEAIEIYQPQHVDADCVRCHLDWKPGETSGVAFFRFSTKNLTQAKAQAEETISGMRFKSLVNSLMAVPMAVVIFAFVVWFVGSSAFKVIDRTVAGLKEVSRQIALASGHVFSVSRKIVDGASEQDRAIGESAASLHEISERTRQNAENAGNANTIMVQTTSMMDEATSSMDDLTESMERISGVSKETSKIIKNIDEIAFQTNLLALNAAVEAARAGEAGAGFAVVADEVRNLAIRAAEAAKNTSDMIQATLKEVGRGAEVVSKTRTAFIRAASEARRAGELVEEISAASKEQAGEVDQINRAIAAIEQVARENAVNARESVSASEEMNGETEKMGWFVSEMVVLVNGRDRDGAGALPGAVERPALPGPEEKEA